PSLILLRRGYGGLAHRPSSAESDFGAPRPKHCYDLCLHDALPISYDRRVRFKRSLVWSEESALSRKRHLFAARENHGPLVHVAPPGPTIENRCFARQAGGEGGDSKSRKPQLPESKPQRSLPEPFPG